MARKEKIINSIFDIEAISKLVPQNIFSIKRKKDIILIISLFLIIISSAGPQWEREFSEAQEFSGNIMIAVDTSLSMSAKDIKPSRLENAKLMIKFLVNSLTNYKIALAAFQGKSYIQCPITNDIDAINYFIDSLKPNILPFPGTNISDTILSCGEYLSKYSGDKLLILITDGEDHSENIEQAIEYAKKLGLRIFTVGIGSEEGDLLSDENGGYKKDKEGHTVLSKLDENTLIKIAHKTQGQYVRYSNPEFVADEIKKFADNLKMSKSKSMSKINYKNHYQIPLLFAFLLILVEFIIMEEESLIKIISKSKNFIIFLSFIFINLSLYSQNPKDLAIKGNKSYNKKDYSKAYEYYKKAAEKSKDPKILFNLGDALYQLENYQEADKYFESINDKKIKSKALYNLGNSKYMQKDIQGAIENYKHAILLDPKDENAKYNLQLILTEKKKQSSKQCNNPNKDEKKKDQENKEKQKNEQKQDKNNSEKEKQEKKQINQILEMMKEKEKENQKNILRQTYNKKENRNDFIDKDW